MDLSFFKEFGLIGGLLLATLFAVWKAGNRVYEQMVQDKKDSLQAQKGIFDVAMAESQKREDKLMAHMEKQGETMAEIAVTLKSMDSRISTLEEHMQEKEGRE